MRATTLGGTSFVERVTVEVGADPCEAVATPLEGEEHERYWAILKELYPFFADHEAAAGGHVARDGLFRRHPHSNSGGTSRANRSSSSTWAAGPSPGR